MSQRSADDVGAMYDHLTDLFTELLGGSMHVGYWDDANDERSIVAASARMTELVADRLALVQGQHVLDIGCGNGRPAAQIATGHDVHVTGITVSSYQLRLAQERPHPADVPGQLSFQLANAMELPFGNESFDGAYALESLLHMNDKDAALRHIARVLRPGARLVIGDLCLDESVGERDAELIANMRELFQISSIPTADDYRKHLHQAGFAGLELTDIRKEVKRTYDVVALGFRQAVAFLDGEIAERLAHSAAVVAQIGELVPLGYLLLTAVRQ